MELELLFQSVIKGFVLCNNNLAVAVSGGVDSIVLLHLIISWSRKNNFPIPTALTVNHGLRPESEKEANFVSNYVQKFGVESFILNWEKENIISNVQSHARKARYFLLTEWCKKNNIQNLFLAHHRDDQVETFLMRLERGSGIDGLSSMCYKYFFNGVYILRPLLDFSRSDIEKYAKSHHLLWVNDKSNQDVKYRRTLYRNLLKVSDNQEILTKRICLTALHMKRAIKALMHYTRIAFDDCVNIHDLGYIEIKLEKFLILPEEIAIRVLLYSIMVIGNKYYKPRYKSFLFIFDKILSKKCDVDHTFSGCRIKKCEKNILIIRESSKIEELFIKLPFTESIRWDNRFSCKIFTNQEISVILTPLEKTQKIPKFLKDYNCCYEVFYSLPSVQKDNKILAYPCINTPEKDINNNEIQYIISCIIKENLVSFFNI